MGKVQISEDDVYVFLEDIEHDGDEQPLWDVMAFLWYLGIIDVPEWND
jgi:hypothetical protein